MRRRAVIILVLFTAVLGPARDSHAFMRWIDKLSGPGPFLGLQLLVRTDTRGHFLESAISALEGPPSGNRFTLGFAAGGALSYRNDLDYRRDGSPTVYLWSLEASVEYWPLRPWGSDDRMNLLVSAGLAANYFTGSRFSSFLRPSLVLRIGPRWTGNLGVFHAVEAGFEAHYFLSGLSPQDFGARPGPEEDRFVPGLFVNLFF